MTATAVVNEHKLKQKQQKQHVMSHTNVKMGRQPPCDYKKTAIAQ